MVSPNLINFPSPPADTVNNINAVNHHPYVVKQPGTYSGDSYYSRTNRRGLNRGWQTGTWLRASEDIFGDDSTMILIKDDLIWATKYGYNVNSSKLNLKVFDDVFPAVRDVIVDADTNKTLYDDIFENGFIQSIARLRQENGSDDKKCFVVFYNNGDVGDEEENSNRWFALRPNDNGEYEVPLIDNDSVKLLKDINESFNNRVLEEGIDRFEVSSTDKSFFEAGQSMNLFQMFSGDEYFNIDGISHFDDLLSRGLGSGISYGNGTNAYRGISENVFPDVIIGKGGQHQFSATKRYLAISKQYPERIYEADRPNTIFEDDIEQRLLGCGRLGTGGVDLTYGSRNRGATNYGVHDEDGIVIDSETTPIYDNGSSIYDFETNASKEGTLSPLKVWKWSGNITTGWVTNALTPPRYNYTSPAITRAYLYPEVAGEWINVNAEISIPSDWELGEHWYLYIYGDGSHTNAENASAYRQQGIVWVDNVSIDFILRDQSETIPVYKPYSAQIKTTNNDGTLITVDKTLREAALEVGANDDFENGGEGDGNPDIYNLTENFNFENFKVTYTNLNPKDLRTYLKFENNLFLTTNFKSDRVSVSQFPYSIVYKLYEPLPDSYEKFDECIVVKEMANPLEEKVRIIDFINEEEPSLVLRSPDLNNVESPVQRRETQFKTEADILTSDTTVSSALRNEFLSQSLDSVEINTDYSKYENFVNFGSAEVRIRNFKTKLENIEQYKIDSASYIGISGSAPDRNLYHHKIIDTENKLDRFENYMYFKSSSYVSSSIGIFHDNAWPKASGEGTVNSPYVLAHTTSSQADTWFTNSVNSASLYDLENNSKLSDILPEHIKIDTKNDTYLKFTDMIGQHFDGIWEYINAVTDVTDRRDRLDEGISKDLLYSVAKSLGWNLNDGKDLLSLSRYALGKEVTGSAYSDYSATSERDVSREIWSRIINNMPFFLKE